MGSKNHLTKEQIYAKIAMLQNELHEISRCNLCNYDLVAGDDCPWPQKTKHCRGLQREAIQHQLDHLQDLLEEDGYV